MLLHGDFHHYNILSATRAEWLAIDPKGMTGDRGYDVGPFVENPRPSDGWSPQLLHRRLDILAEELEYDRARLRDWAIAYAVLSACWSAEDHGQGWETTPSRGRTMLVGLPRVDRRGGRRTDGRGLGPEARDVRRVHLLPARAESPGGCLTVEVVGQGVEADVPARGIAGAFAKLVERVHERQQAAVAVRLQLEPQRLVIAPAELQHRRRLIPEHLAVDRRALAVAEREAQRRAGRAIASDLGGEPGREVGGLGERPPDLFGRVAEFAREAQLQSASRGVFELPEVCWSSIHALISSWCVRFGVGHGIQVLFEQVEARRPQLAVGRQPRVEGLERCGTQPVDAPLRVGADVDEAGVAQDAQMLGHRRLADGEVVDEVADGQIGAPEQIQDAAPVGLGEDLERRVHVIDEYIHWDI